VDGKNIFIVNIGVLLITTVALGMAGILSFRRMKAV
jgi:hypothetical protein